MVDVTIASTDVAVIGGPSIVEVDVNFGPQGSRGSYIYNVTGNPNDVNTAIPSDIQLLDMAINSKDYSIYQYINDPTIGLTWKPVLSLLTAISGNSINVNKTLTFDSNGIATTAFLMDGFVNANALSATPFNIVCDINTSSISDAPVAHSVKYATRIDNIGQGYVDVTITAKKIVGTTISALTGSIPVYFNIAIAVS